MLLASLVFLPFLASIIAALMPQNARNHESWLAAAVALCGLLVAAKIYPAIAAGEVLRAEFDWLPAQGLQLVLRIDGLAWVFAVLVLVIGLLVVLYARYYMSPEDPVPRFFSFLLAFMGSMLGVVLAGNLVQLVVFWELTSFTSFLLIGYWHHRADARRGARMAFTVTASGGLCLLAGVLVLGHIAGSYDLDHILAQREHIQAHSLYSSALILIALGALTKSAQFPFHFWLPHAMAAPTPVSSYLHSATMVKAGVFLLIRLWPALAGTPEWTWIIAIAGLCTMLIGAFTAIFQHDLKGLLAYSTISHLGLITLLIGIGSPAAMVAAIFHVLNHATFKASLFMAAGIIDHETGTRDLRLLRGLRHQMPITATLAVVASASMAGVPLLNGFLSKEMFFAETLHVGGWSLWLASAAISMGVFSVAYSLRFISIFFGTAQAKLPREPHEPPRWMRFPVEFLVLICLIVGIVPALSIEPILNLAVFATLGQSAPHYNLALWHGLNLPLLMSLVALCGGVLLYTQLHQRLNPCERTSTPLIGRFNGAQAYETAMQSLTRSAEWLLKLLGTVRTQPQLYMIMLCLLVLPLALSGVPESWTRTALQPVDPFFVALWLIGGACAIAGAWMAKYHRLAALVLFGGTGVVTAATFLWLSAPDLALTQLMVETVTTVLILLGLRWLPPRLANHGSDANTAAQMMLRRTLHMALAIASGLAMAALSFAVLIHPAAPSIADFFLQKALSEGGGSNVVNVLLVDFRSFDTMGEVTVLSIVALTVFALLRRFRPAPESTEIPPQQRHAFDPANQQAPAEQALSGYLMVASIYLRLLLPFMGIIAVYFFMRGHNQPGGGFVAGLIFAVAIIVQYMLAGTHWVESHITMRPLRWLGVGLLLLLLTGVGAWPFAHPFLTTHTAAFSLPLLGDFHLPSALFFDLGVFAVVVGTTMLILVALAHQSLRAHRKPEGSEEFALTGTQEQA